MPHIEILKEGKLVRRQAVSREKALAGCGIRLGAKTKITLKLGESADVENYRVRVVDDTDAPMDSQSSTAAVVPRLDGYEIQSPLGEGGMGTVWKGIQLSTNRAVAIKFLSARAFNSERSQRRFKREVELSAKLEHPNIARIYDSGLRHGAYYYAMELVQGIPLDQFVKQQKPEPKTILELLRTVCQAVQHAHERGVVHRDLKPGNILVDSADQVHVVDFGLAKSLLIDEAEKQLTVSIDGDIAGTPAYMSPEQAAGRVDQIDARTDVYALGVIAYTLLTGSNPHDLSGSYLQVIKRIAEEEVRPPEVVGTKLDADLKAILNKALRLEREERYQSAKDFGDDIGRYLNDQHIIARPATLMYMAGKRLKKNRWTAVSVVAAVVLLGLAAAIGYRMILAAHQRAESAAAEAQRATALERAAEQKERDAQAALNAQQRQLEKPNQVAPTTAPIAVASAPQPAVPMVATPVAQPARNATDSKANEPSQLPNPSFWSFSPTPPMGWDSWVSYGASVTEDEVLANAAYMRDHLLSHGWKYVVIDWRWYADGAHVSDGKSPATFSIDRYGRLMPSVQRFPSASDGQGFTQLAAKIHAMGLKFGIHIVRGIPRQAVAANLPIEGSNFNAADAADTESTVKWSPEMFGVNGNSDAGRAWYDSIVRQYAKWGVDFLKVDALRLPDQDSEVKAIRAAIDHCGRPIVLDLCTSKQSLARADELKNVANLWQISGDGRDNWLSVIPRFDAVEQWQGQAGPGHWPDADDNMCLGYLGPRCPFDGASRQARLTRNEQMLCMTMWAIAPSPLMLGMNLTHNDAWTESLLTNDAVLAVNQDPLGQPAMLVAKSPLQVWSKGLADHSIAMGLFNLTDHDANITVPLDGKQSVRNLWTGQDPAIRQGSMSFPVPTHGAMLLRVSSVSPSLQDQPKPTEPMAGRQMLFDGSDLSNWQSRKDGSPAQWTLRDGYMEVNGSGDIVTRQEFQDFTLHIEFFCPDTGSAKGQHRANSGIFLQDRYEVQVLDSFGVNPPGNEDCGAIWGQKAPDVNACKPPEQWQTYDITFHAARFDAAGRRIAKAVVTILQNGQSIQKDVQLDGPTGSGAVESADPGPIRLQDYGNAVRFRNIWIVPAKPADPQAE